MEATKRILEERCLTIYKEKTKRNKLFLYWRKDEANEQFGKNMFQDVRWNRKCFRRKWAMATKKRWKIESRIINITGRIIVCEIFGGIVLWICIILMQKSKLQ